jgi:hypothetical protein
MKKVCTWLEYEELFIAKLLHEKLMMRYGLIVNGVMNCDLLSISRVSIINIYFCFVPITHLVLLV